MNKKGAMEISINMIIILIIAVVILGLALGFVRGMFGQMTQTFEEQAADEPDAPGATPGNRLTMSRGSNIVTSRGEVILLKWGVYCGLDEECENMNVSLSCGLEGIELEVMTKNVGANQNDQLLSLLDVPNAVLEGTYLCSATLKAENQGDANLGSMDFSLRVTR